MEADHLDDWELTTTSNAITLVVVGKTGNGKSATGNNILGREAFKSDLSASGVTCTSEMQSIILRDGRSVNIIDTPGLYDLSSGSENVGKEIVKCIDLAKDGIHAVLMVFSIISRFTSEEEAAIQSMKTLFGDKIVSYMIVVFTGGDTLESKGKTLNDYISRCPDPLKNIIELCNNRVILFGNATRDRIKREEQLNQLLLLVDSVVRSNGGKPFTDQIFAQVKENALRRRQMEKEAEAKKGCTEEELFALKEEIHKSYDDQLKCIAAMVEQKLNTIIERLEKQLAEEQAARLQAETFAKESREKSDEEFGKLKEDMKRAYEEIHNRTESKCISL